MSGICLIACISKYNIDVLKLDFSMKNILKYPKYVVKNFVKLKNEKIHNTTPSHRYSASIKPIYSLTIILFILLKIIYNILNLLINF